jgi:hypothetical protein
VLAVASALLVATAIPPEPILVGGPGEEASVTQTSASFSFIAPGREPVFECSLNSVTAFASCVSPHVVAGLTPGRYTFRVRVVEGTEAGPTAARTWTVLADADGDGFSPPADCDDANAATHPGAIEIPNNAVDEDCSGADHVIVIPPISLQTIPTIPIPIPMPTPTPSPAAPKPKIAFTLSYFMNARKRETRFSTLSVKGVPKGARLKITCRGGCPRKRQTLTRSGTVALTAFRRKALKVGAKLTIAVTKPGMTGMAKVVTIRSGKRPRITTKLLS